MIRNRRPSTRRPQVDAGGHVEPLDTYRTPYDWERECPELVPYHRLVSAYPRRELRHDDDDRER